MKPKSKAKPRYSLRCNNQDNKNKPVLAYPIRENSNKSPTYNSEHLTCRQKKPKNQIQISNPSSTNHTDTLQKKRLFHKDPTEKVSISSKDDIEKNVMKKISFNKQTGNSIALTTNYTEKSDTENTKKSKIETTKNNETEQEKIDQLRLFFKTSDLKKTIIIDGEGNNNLGVESNLFQNYNNNKVKNAKSINLDKKMESCVRINEHNNKLSEISEAINDNIENNNNATRKPKKSFVGFKKPKSNLFKNDAYFTNQFSTTKKSNEIKKSSTITVQSNQTNSKEKKEKSKNNTNMKVSEFKIRTDESYEEPSDHNGIECSRSAKNLFNQNQKTSKQSSKSKVKCKSNNKKEEKVEDIKKHEIEHKKTMPIQKNKMFDLNFQNINDDKGNNVEEIGKIFNFLNQNIEQMKEIFAMQDKGRDMNKNMRSPKKLLKNLSPKGNGKVLDENSLFVKTPISKNQPINIFSDEVKESINKVTPVFENIEFLAEQFSFLDSCIQEEFYQNLAKEKNNGNETAAQILEFSSFLSSKMENNKEFAINNSIEQIQCENEDVDEGAVNTITINNMKPHIHSPNPNLQNLRSQQLIPSINQQPQPLLFQHPQQSSPNKVDEQKPQTKQYQSYPSKNSLNQKKAPPTNNCIVF